MLRSVHDRVHERPVPLIVVISETVGDAARGVRATIAGVARQVPRRRIVAAASLMVILVAVVALVPLPTAVELRDWAASRGPWFLLVFLVAHILVTIFPFPRTAFTLSAGLLFGPALGVGVAVLASTVSALAALLIIRAFGWQMHRVLTHPRVETVNAWLDRRGWASIVSLRLIPVVPFSVLNYAAGASAVRVFPFFVATVFGLLPGTAALVLLGDALTGDVSPLLLAISVCTACVGVAGLAWEIRKHRRESAVPAPTRAREVPVGSGQ